MHCIAFLTAGYCKNIFKLKALWMTQGLLTSPYATWMDATSYVSKSHFAKPCQKATALECCKTLQYFATHNEPLFYIAGVFPIQLQQGAWSL